MNRKEARMAMIAGKRVFNTQMAGAVFWFMDDSGFIYFNDFGVDELTDFNTSPSDGYTLTRAQETKTLPVRWRDSTVKNAKGFHTNSLAKKQNEIIDYLASEPWKDK